MSANSPLPSASNGLFVEVLKGTIQGMDNQRVKEQFGLETDAQVAEFKANKIASLQEVADNYKKNRRIAQSFIGKGSLPKDFRGKESILTDSLAFALTMSQSSERLAVDSIATLKEIFAGIRREREGDTVDIIGIFALAPR